MSAIARMGVIASSLRASSGATDPNFANVSLLLHGDGTNGSTIVTDSSGSPKTVTCNASAALSTAQFKYGNASILFNGSTDYLTIPTNTAFDFGSGDFTIEMWVRPTSVTGTYLLASRWLSGTPTSDSYIFYLAAGQLQLSFGVGGTTSGTPSTSAILANVWTHVAVVRSGTTGRYFINGTLDATTFTMTGALNTNTGDFVIGCIDNGNFRYPGYIDDIRITKGVARYSSSFTAPAAPFPNS